METTIDREITDTPDSLRDEAMQTLQEQFAGVRLAKSRMGISKSLTDGQKDVASMPFDMDKEFLRATKKLINTNDPAYKKVSAILTQVTNYFKVATLPYPEDAIRLVKRTALDSFQSKIEGFKAELENAVYELDWKMEDLKREAEKKLGELYNAADYPRTVKGLFSISIDYPNLAPPDYLRTANPKLYEEQSARIAARFDAAVSLAEDTFAAELSDCIETLQRKLQGLDDGTEKRLKESTMDNLTEFFQRFRKLNLHSSKELDKVVNDAEAILSGKSLFGKKSISRDDLRNSQALRADVKTRLSAVTAQLDGLMTTAPRRAINRRKPQE